MAVEMHTRSGSGARTPCNDVDARMALAVAGSARGTYVVYGEAASTQAIADEFSAGAVCFAGRIYRREANQRAGQFDQLLAAPIDGLAETLRGVCGHGAPGLGLCGVPRACERGAGRRLGREFRQP